MENAIFYASSHHIHKHRENKIQTESLCSEALFGFLSLRSFHLLSFVPICSTLEWTEALPQLRYWFLHRLRLACPVTPRLWTRRQSLVLPCVIILISNADLKYCSTWYSWLPRCGCEKGKGLLMQHVRFTVVYVSLQFILNTQSFVKWTYSNHKT